MEYQLEDETSFGRIISKCLSMHPRLLDSNNFRVDAAHFNKLLIHLILIALNNLINSQNYLYEKEQQYFPDLPSGYTNITPTTPTVFSIHISPQLLTFMHFSYTHSNLVITLMPYQ